MGPTCRHRPGLGAFCGVLRRPRQRPCAFCVRRSAVLRNHHLGPVRLPFRRSAMPGWVVPW